MPPSHRQQESPAPTMLTTAETRIQIDTYTPRWDHEVIDLSDALDFWSAAAAAANVIMQMSLPRVGHGVAESRVERSEEHTSELQSRGHLVCRLLLEEKSRAIAPHRATSYPTFAS